MSALPSMPVGRQACVSSSPCPPCSPTAIMPPLSCPLHASRNLPPPWRLQGSSTAHAPQEPGPILWRIRKLRGLEHAVNPVLLNSALGPIRSLVDSKGSGRWGQRCGTTPTFSTCSNTTGKPRKGLVVAASGILVRQCSAHLRRSKL